MNKSRVLFFVGLFLIVVATVIYAVFVTVGGGARSAEGGGEGTAARVSYGALTVPSAHYEYFQTFYAGNTVADSSGSYHGTSSEPLQVDDDGTIRLSAAQTIEFPVGPLGSLWTVMVSARYLETGAKGQIVGVKGASDTWFGWSGGTVGVSSVDGAQQGQDTGGDRTAFQTVAVKNTARGAFGAQVTADTLPGNVGIQAVSASADGSVIMQQCARVWDTGDYYVSVYRWNGTSYVAQDIYDGTTTATQYVASNMQTCGNISGDGSTFVYAKVTGPGTHTLAQVLEKFVWSEANSRFERQAISGDTSMSITGANSDWWCVQVNHDGTMVEVTSPMSYTENPSSAQYTQQEARSWLFDDSASTNAYANQRTSPEFFSGHSDAYPVGRRAGWTADKRNVIFGGTKHYTRESAASTTWTLAHSLTFPAHDGYANPQSVRWSSDCRRAAVLYANGAASAILVWRYDLAGGLTHERTMPCSFETYAHPSRPQALGLANDGDSLCVVQRYSVGVASMYTSAGGFAQQTAHSSESSSTRCNSADISADGQVMVYAVVGGAVHVRRAAFAGGPWASSQLTVNGSASPSDCAIREIRVYDSHLSEAEMAAVAAEMDDPVVVPHALDYGSGDVVAYVGAPLAAVTPSWTGSNATVVTDSADLPSHGLALNATTGVISGTPTSALAAQAVTFTVANQAGSGTAQRTVVIYEAPSLTLADFRPVVGRASSSAAPAMVPAPDERVQYTSFAVTSGTLPDGLALDASTGVISGTLPDGAEVDTTVVVSATLTAYGRVDSAAFRIVSSAAPPAAPAALDPPNYGTSARNHVTAFEGATKMWFGESALSELRPSNAELFASFASPNAMDHGVTVDGSSGAVSALPSKVTASKATQREGLVEVLVTGTTADGATATGVVHLMASGKQLTRIRYNPVLRAFANEAFTVIPSVDGDAVNYSKVTADLWPAGVDINEQNGHLVSEGGMSDRAAGLSVQAVLLGDIKSSNEFELRPCDRVTYDAGGIQGLQVVAAGFFVGEVGTYISIPLALPQALSRSSGDVAFSSSVALPRGMAVDADTGTVYGTPSAAAKLSQVWIEAEVDGRYYGERYSLEVRETAGKKHAWAAPTSYSIWGLGALCWAASAWTYFSTK